MTGTTSMIYSMVTSFHVLSVVTTCHACCVQDLQLSAEARKQIAPFGAGVAHRPGLVLKDRAQKAPRTG